MSTQRPLAALLVLTALAIAAPIHIAAEQTVTRLQVSSYTEIAEAISEMGYTEDAWNDGIRSVPRLVLADLPTTWNGADTTTAAAERSRLFFRLLAPAVLRANEILSDTRQRVETMLVDLEQGETPAADDAAWIAALARLHRVQNVDPTSLSARVLQPLMEKINTIPPSLVLADAADDCGWGTARFANTGDGLFDGWAWMKRPLSDEAFALFEDDESAAPSGPLLRSVMAFMFDLNSNTKYAGFRARRDEMRRKDPSGFSGLDFLRTLSSVPGWNQQRVNTVQEIIREAALRPIDRAELEDGPTTVLAPTES